MASHASISLADGHTLTITSHMVVGLDLRPYREYRLEERDGTGTFVGFAAFGSRFFVESAAARRLQA